MPPTGATTPPLSRPSTDKLYGYVHAGRALEIVTARVEVRGRSATSTPASHRVRPAPTGQPCADLLERPLARGAGVHAPAIGPGRHDRRTGTDRRSLVDTVIDPGWRAEVLSQGELLLIAPTRRRHESRRQRHAALRPTWPIRFCWRSSIIGWPASPTKWASPCVTRPAA